MIIDNSIENQKLKLKLKVPLSLNQDLVVFVLQPFR